MLQHKEDKKRFQEDITTVLAMLETPTISALYGATWKQMELISERVGQVNEHTLNVKETQLSIDKLITLWTALKRQIDGLREN